jgi:pimeloyl-ACP methyl ester carboxylesterase
LLDIQLIDSYTNEAINDFSRNFYPENNFLPARYMVDRYQVRFQTLNQRHELSTVRAELFVPRVDTPTEFPLLVYGSGTTGIGHSCAPLDELTRGRNWGSYRTHMLSYATQGYIAILPLWQGYDDLARTHPYFVAELEGPVLLDATRAVYQFFGAMPMVQARPAAAVFFAGYSQGAHGAFAADAIAPAYASELPIKGIIGHASAPNVEALLREAPSLAPYIVYAFRNYYGTDLIDPAQVFQPQWLPTFDNDASTKCVDEIYDYYQGGQANIYRPEFSQALYGDRLGFDFPYFKQALDNNDIGRATNPQVPALLLHGSADPIVTQQTNEQFMRQICRQGKAVTYYLYTDVHHFQTRQYSFVDTLNWMQAILTGVPVRSDCATILAQ